MVKGDAIVEVCYVNAQDKSCTETIKHNLPINQILEFDGMEERYNGDVFLCVSSTDVLMKGESAGNATSLDVSLVLDARITMWEEKELLIITDAYSVNSCIDLKKQKYSKI